MSLDVLLREVHEEIERFCSTKGPEGTLAEGYTSYETFYYASEYIRQIDNRPGVVIWDDERDEYTREGESLQMNGKKHLIKSKKLIIFQIYTK